MQVLKLIPLIAFAAFTLSSPVVAKPVPAKNVPSATASFTGETVAIGVGFTWGKGVLTFKGKTYPFKVDGLSAIGAGITKISGTGTVYHLESAADFAGNYAAVGAGASVGSHGEASASLRNEKGVVIDFHAKQKGISLNLAVSGVRIKMTPD